MLTETRRGYSGSSGDIVTSVYDPSCGHWKPNLGTLQECQILSTSEPSVHALPSLL